LRGICLKEGRGGLRALGSRLPVWRGMVSRVDFRVALFMFVVESSVLRYEKIRVLCLVGILINVMR
jgi:hypothetical protein